MSSLAEDNVDNKAGKKFRLVVRSAEEAVRVIREKLGEDARVLSVKQVGGEGLKRFISSPKLEVIAEVPVDKFVETSNNDIGDESAKKQMFGFGGDPVGALNGLGWSGVRFRSVLFG